MFSLGECALEEQIYKEEIKFNLLKEEDELYDENGNNSNEESSEEHLRSHFEGMTDGDIMNVEREVEDLMESVRNLQTTLSEDARVGDMFGAEMTGEQGSGKGTTLILGDENVKASIEEIEKMDAILRMKAAEERRAKLCRIQAEEESRDILSKLPCTRESNVNKVNLEEFIRLLNDFGETGSDSLGFQSLNRMDEVGDKERSKDNGGVEMKMGSKGGEERKAKHFKFVEKNIQLAKCGRGTLSLTDEEKERIEELLVEAEDSGGGGATHHANGIGGLTKDFYAIDDETKSVLTKIDQQLEAVTKAQGAERSGSNVSLLEKHTKEEDVCEKEKNEKNISEKGKGEEKKRGNRLTEINKLLNAVNSVTHEEIIPLSEEEMGSLLEQSKRSLEEEEGAGREEDDGSSPAERALSVNCKGSEDVISELVANAKLLMPKFKYRFVDS